MYVCWYLYWLVETSLVNNKTGLICDNTREYFHIVPGSTCGRQLVGIFSFELAFLQVSVVPSCSHQTPQGIFIRLGDLQVCSHEKQLVVLSPVLKASGKRKGGCWGEWGRSLLNSNGKTWDFWFGLYVEVKL